MSNLSDSTHELLKKVFPHNVILKEHYVKYKGIRLFFDFYIKDLGVFIECQGPQHDEYISYFHGDKAGFMEQKKRDNLKKEYCQSKKLTLVEVRIEDGLDENKLIEFIWSKLDD